MKLKFLFLVQTADSQVQPAVQKVNFIGLRAVAGEIHKFELAHSVEPDKVLPAETYLSPSFLYGQLVTFNQGQVDRAGLITHIPCPLDIDFARNIAQARIASAIITFLGLSPNSQGQKKNTYGQERK